MITLDNEKNVQTIDLNTTVNTADMLEGGMAEYWKDRSSSYSKQNLGQLFSSKKEVWENLIFSQVSEDRPLDVLDIGTGPGFFAILSAMRGHRVTAVDMSEDMLDKARRNSKLMGTNIDFRQVGRLLPFENKKFDLIMSRDVTWTLTDPETQMKNWASKLKVGGTMVYFDAEWYYYLKDGAYRAAWEENRRKIIEKGGFVYSRTADLERLAFDLPMTYKNRPLWDRHFWAGQPGFKFEVLENLNPYVYNTKEQMQYELYPEFLVVIRRIY